MHQNRCRFCSRDTCDPESGEISHKAGGMVGRESSKSEILSRLKYQLFSDLEGAVGSDVRAVSFSRGQLVYPGLLQVQNA